MTNYVGVHRPAGRACCELVFGPDRACQCFRWSHGVVFAKLPCTHIHMYIYIYVYIHTSKNCRQKRYFTSNIPTLQARNLQAHPWGWALQGLFGDTLGLGTPLGNSSAVYGDILGLGLGTPRGEEFCSISSNPAPHTEGWEKLHGYIYIYMCVYIYIYCFL